MLFLCIHNIQSFNGFHLNKAKQSLLDMDLQEERKRRGTEKAYVIVKETRGMLILPLRWSRLSLKENQSAGTEFHNLDIHGKWLLATFVRQYLIQIFPSQKDKVQTMHRGWEITCLCEAYKK